MTQNNELYEHILAARIVYQDTYENEIDIIKELKIYLVESGISPSGINETLYNFYQHNDIPISLESIEEISFNSDPIINNLVEFIFNPANHYINSLDTIIQQNDNDNDNDDETDDDINENIVQIHNNTATYPNNIINILNTLVTNLNNNNNNTFIQINNIPPQQFQNVVVTVDDDDFEKLNSEILTEDHELSCSICMSHMKKDEKITLLNCKHAFHCDCISPYLKEFNYKCPICRSEVGKAKYNF